MARPFTYWSQAVFARRPAWPRSRQRSPHRMTRPSRPTTAIIPGGVLQGNLFGRRRSRQRLGHRPNRQVTLDHRHRRRERRAGCDASRVDADVITGWLQLRRQQRLSELPLQGASWRVDDGTNSAPLSADSNIALVDIVVNRPPIAAAQNVVAVLNRKASRCPRTTGEPAAHLLHRGARRRTARCRR